MPSAAGIKAGKAFIIIDAMDMTARAFAGIRKNIYSLGSTMSAVGQSIAVTSALMFSPFSIGMRKFAEFDDALRKLVGKSTGKVKDLLDMERTALILSKNMGVGIKDIVDIARTLVEGGLEGDALKKVLPQVLLLAKAAGDASDQITDLRHAAGAVTGILNAYRMDVSSAARVVDILAKVVNKTNINMEDLNVIVSYAATVAAEYRVSLEELMSVMGVFRDVNMDASVAATAFRNILLYSTSKTELDKFNEKLAELTGKVIEFTDASGKLKSPIVFLTAIGEVLKTIDDETIRGELLSNLFGTRSTVPSMQIVKNIDKLSELIVELRNSSGTATKMAQFMESGFGGKLRKLLGQLSSLVSSFKVLAPTFDMFIMLIGRAVTWLEKFIYKNRDLINVIVQLIAVSGAFGVGMIVVGKILRMVGMIMTPVAYALVIFSRTLSFLSHNGVPQAVRSLNKLGSMYLFLYRWSRTLAKTTGFLSSSIAKSWMKATNEALTNWGVFTSSITKKVSLVYREAEGVIQKSFIGWARVFSGKIFSNKSMIRPVTDLNKMLTSTGPYKALANKLNNILKTFSKLDVLFQIFYFKHQFAEKAAADFLGAFEKHLKLGIKNMPMRVHRFAEFLYNNIFKIKGYGTEKFVNDFLNKALNQGLSRVYKVGNRTIVSQVRSIQRYVEVLGGAFKAFIQDYQLVEYTAKKVGKRIQVSGLRFSHDVKRLIGTNQRLVSATIFGVTQSAFVSANAIQRLLNSTNKPFMLWLGTTMLVAKHIGYWKFGFTAAFGALKNLLNMDVSTFFGGITSFLWTVAGIIMTPIKEGAKVVWDLIKKGWNGALELTAKLLNYIAADPIGLLIKGITAIVAALMVVVTMTVIGAAAWGILKAIIIKTMGIMTSALASMPILFEKMIEGALRLGKRLTTLYSIVHEYVKVAMDANRFDLAAKLISTAMKIAFLEIRNEAFVTFRGFAAGFIATIMLVKELTSKLMKMGSILVKIGRVAAWIVPDSMGGGMMRLFNAVSGWFQETTEDTIDSLSERWVKLKEKAEKDLEAGDARRAQELENAYTELHSVKMQIRVATGRNPELERLEQDIELGLNNTASEGVYAGMRTGARRAMRSEIIPGWKELPEEIGGGRVWVGPGKEAAVAEARRKLAIEARNAIRPAPKTLTFEKIDVIKAAEKYSSDAFRSFYENMLVEKDPTVERLDVISDHLRTVPKMAEDIGEIRKRLTED